MGRGADEMLTVGSLFSGIGGFDLGLERAGLRVAWQCEKDEAAGRVLARHWPDVPCYPDVKDLDGREPTVDVLCGGFPCQDLSVAGRRAGLAGERSGLFHEFMRVAAEHAPRWVLVENVPGLLSSNDGRDMGVVLGVLADLGYGWCYRVLDAQWFGVAQRRRRVFIVGCLGDARRAGEVLLESSCCDGDSAPSREAGQEIAGSLEACPPGHRQRADASDNLVMAGALAFHQTQEPITGEDWTPALGATSIGMGVAYPLAMRGRDDGADTLRSHPRPGSNSNGAMVMAFAENQRGEVLETPYSRQLTAGGGKPGQGYPAVRDGMAVRRLMPVECERLQGFPDGWTADETDSARYRMLGNAICVPVAQWIGQRLAEVA